tara:strand:+ start:7528 stop:8613 length:1086 start_codon:yes stop_codon:yes gene_type:complete
MIKTYIIAEAGVNHNGKIKHAKKLIDIAVDAGADAVKFQLFNSDMIVTKLAGKARYQLNRNKDETQYSMLKKLELKKSELMELSNYCINKKIDFLCSAFDSDSLKFLIKNIKIKTLKIASGEITNAPFLLEHARSGKNIILSTGASNLREVTDALSVISYGLLNKKKFKNEKLTIKKFRDAYNSKKAKKLLQKKVTILHCTSHYPAPIDEVNLLAIKLMKHKFGLKLGYSDHTNNKLTLLSAVCLGASVLEKHFTINKNMSGPDHKSSANPKELCEMIRQIRIIEKIMGKKEKKLQKSETENLKIIRKSIVAKDVITTGKQFNKNNIQIKRPGNGINPFLFWKLIGKKSKKSYKIDDFIID